MAKNEMSKIRLCRFDSIADIKNPTYEQIKERVLDVGRFSSFDPMPRTAHYFNRLAKDPDLELFVMGYPWTGVRRKHSGTQR